jgi:hypothetical protein
MFLHASVLSVIGSELMFAWRFPMTQFFCKTTSNPTPIFQPSQAKASKQSKQAKASEQAG